MDTNKLWVQAKMLSDTIKSERDNERLGSADKIDSMDASELCDRFDPIQYIDGSEESVDENLNQISRAMAKSDAFGFNYHDKGFLDTANAYFFVKDRVMFDRLLKEEIIEEEELVKASVSYGDALDVKDFCEWAGLPDEAKIQKAGDGEIAGEYLDMSAEELYELYKDESDLRLSESDVEELGIRDVSATDFNGQWEGLLSDQNLDFLRDKFSRRGDILDIEDDLYSDFETWWLQHKAGRRYHERCSIARYAELASATGLDEFYDYARSLKAVMEDNWEEAVSLSPKPSDGQGGNGVLASYYLDAVEDHDRKNPVSNQLMVEDVAPYYKATLFPLFEHDSNQYSAELVEAFGQTYRLEDLGSFRELIEEELPDLSQIKELSTPA